MLALNGTGKQECFTVWGTGSLRQLKRLYTKNRDDKVKTAVFLAIL